ncbi:uncharacterized protein A4U43_C05F11850, partial [Asparagus officinalis]
MERSWRVGNRNEAAGTVPDFKHLVMSMLVVSREVEDDKRIWGCQPENQKSNDSSWRTLGSRADRNKENTSAPTVWSSYKVPHKTGTGAVPTPSSMHIEVFVDKESAEGEQQVEITKSSKPSTLQLRKANSKNLKKETELLRENPLHNFPRRPCDIVGDVSYEELRVVAYEDAKKGLPLQAISAGLPWTVAKGQDTFTPISAVLPKSAIRDPDNVELWLKVDDEIRQKGSTRDMIFKIPFLISHISSIMTLMEGDVILTGTPQGVGPVRAGQKITAGISGIIDVQFDVQKRQRAAS